MSNIIQGLLKGDLFAETDFKTSVTTTPDTYKPNEKIMQAGVNYPHFFLVRKGKVKVILKNEKNTRHSFGSIIAELGEGELFGEFSIFDDQPSKTEVSAVTITQITKIDKSSFMNFLELNPKVGYQVLYEMTRHLIRRLRDENRLVSRVIDSTIDMQKKAKRA